MIGSVMSQRSSDELLDRIFSITQNLYKEMSLEGGGEANDHTVIFRLLTDLGRTLVNADRASFWKWDKRSHELWTTAAVGTGRITIPEGTGLVGKALAEKRTIITNDPYNHPDFNSDVDKKTGYVTKSILVMPIANCRGEFIGAYQAINKLDNDGKFDLEEDTKRLSLAAFICGITLESDTFLDDSQHDKLTELKNRMGFYNDYNKVYSKILADTENVRSISMFICDIDFFKKVNDTYGHEAGDLVLVQVAELLSSYMKSRGCVGRWGGEEFLLIFKDINGEEAYIELEKIRSMVQRKKIVYNDQEISITMTFGLEEYSYNKPVDYTINNADQKLYLGKNQGRNRVIF